MEVKYGLKRNSRKELVKALTAIIGKDSKYLGVPSCAYQVGEVIVTKDGILQGESLMEIVEGLKLRGYEPTEAPAWEDNDRGEELVEEPAERAITGLRLEINTTGQDVRTIDNFKALLKGKHSLICHALGVECLEIEEIESGFAVDWFKGLELNPDEINAYANFIGRLWDFAKERKRVNLKEDKAADNEKYAFRCFLLRLGFIGAEYKLQRKILLKRLEGSSAFKAGRQSAE